MTVPPHVFGVKRTNLHEKYDYPYASLHLDLVEARDWIRETVD